MKSTDLLLDETDINQDAFILEFQRLVEIHIEKRLAWAEMAIDVFGNACARFPRGRVLNYLNCTETDDLVEFVDERGRCISWIDVSYYVRKAARIKKELFEDAFSIAYILRRNPYRDGEKPVEMRPVAFKNSKRYGNWFNH